MKISKTTEIDLQWLHEGLCLRKLDQGKAWKGLDLWSLLQSLRLQLLPNSYLVIEAEVAMSAFSTILASLLLPEPRTWLALTSAMQSRAQGILRLSILHLLAGLQCGDELRLV